MKKRQNEFNINLQSCIDIFKYNIIWSNIELFDIMKKGCTCYWHYDNVLLNRFSSKKKYREFFDKVNYGLEYYYDRL